MLEARCILFAEGVTVVEGARRLLGVSAAVEDEAGAAPDGHACEPAPKVEEERDFQPAFEHASRIVPTVPRERRAHGESAPEAVCEPEGSGPGQVEDPERAGVGIRQRAQQPIYRSRDRLAAGCARKRTTMVERGSEGRGAEPRLERADSAAPGKHRAERARFGNHRCLRHQLPRKFIAPTMTAASTMKRPSSSMPSIRLSA